MSNNSTNTNTNNLDSQIIGIKDSLADMYNNYGKAIASSQSLIDQQKTMRNIVSDEQKRIQYEQRNMKQILDTNTRNNELKENLRKRQNAYNYLLFVAIIILLICVFIAFIKNMFPMIPEGIFTFLYIIVLTVGIIFLSYLYYGISTRNMLNFDELHFNYSPVAKDIDSITQAQAKAQAKGDLLGGIFNPNLCIGSDCCTDKTIFDKGIAKCITPCEDKNKIRLNGRCIVKSECKDENKVCGKSCIPSTDTCFTDEAFSGFNINRNVEPFSPCEFEDYQRYNK
jgi:TM2 domain-containing membrane protein YozV